MSQILEQLHLMDPAALARIVGKTVHCTTVQVIRWSAEPLARSAINPVTQGLYSVCGLARTEVALIPWSLILKVIHWVDVLGNGGHGYHTDPEDWNYWKREALVFQSGIVADMRDEAARGNGAAGTRRRYQRHLRVILGRDVAELHGVTAGDAQPLDPRLQLGIGIELIDALIAGAGDIG